MSVIRRGDHRSRDARQGKRRTTWERRALIRRPGNAFDLRRRRFGGRIIRSWRGEPVPGLLGAVFSAARVDHPVVRVHGALRPCVAKALRSRDVSVHHPFDLDLDQTSAVGLMSVAVTGATLQNRVGIRHASVVPADISGKPGEADARRRLRAAPADSPAPIVSSGFTNAEPRPGMVWPRTHRRCTRQCPSADGMPDAVHPVRGAGRGFRRSWQSTGGR
jgi:hypothetical protein